MNKVKGCVAIIAILTMVITVFNALKNKTALPLDRYCDLKHITIDNEIG